MSATPRPNEHYISFNAVSKSFNGTPAVSNVSFEVAEGEAIVLLGPSGCGKTTCLRLIAGFERPDAGVIEIQQRTVATQGTFVPPESRGLGVVFQSYALWPHMTVRENVAFGPRLLRLKSAEVEKKVSNALTLVQLQDYAGRYPHELSGGQQQRVALARALVIEPRALLLDEPLSNLDTQLRQEMRFEIKRIQRALNMTMIHVTHDRDEALALADRIVVLNAGKIQQIGSPRQIYDEPRNSFVSRVLGTSNVVPLRFEEHLGGNRMAASIDNQKRIIVSVPSSIEDQAAYKRLTPSSTVKVSIRPDRISLHPRGIRNDQAISAQVVDALFVGGGIEYIVKLEGTGQELSATVPSIAHYQAGEKVAITIADKACTLLEDDLDRLN